MAMKPWKTSSATNEARNACPFFRLRLNQSDPFAGTPPGDLHRHTVGTVSVGTVSDFVLGSYVKSSKPKRKSDGTHHFPSSGFTFAAAASAALLSSRQGCRRAAFGRGGPM